MDATQFGAGVATAVRQSAGIGAYVVGALTGSNYATLLGLRSAAERALERGDLDTAGRRAHELLERAEDFRSDWYFGNAIHHGHRLLGHVALERGDDSEAERRLLESGRTPGSPQLNSFGPNMSLALGLLERGRSDVVVEYLRACGDFWSNPGTAPAGAGDTTRLDDWILDIQEGRHPDFGPNLIY